MLKNELGFESQIEKLDRRISILEIVAWSFVGLGLIGLFVGFYFWYCLNGELNEVGDFIGGVTGSLWALAGLFFIYIAFLGQKVEIKYQQEDLTLTREELKETKEVFKQQTQVMISQQLDNTFFNLLDNHRKLVNSFSTKKERYEGFFRSMIDRKKANEPVSGYEVLENISKAWRDLFEKHSKYHSSRKIFDFNIANKQPLKIVKNEKDVLLLYNEVIDIMNFIKNRIYINNRVFYFKILRNNLTFDERYLVEAYNYFFGNEELPYSFNQFVVKDYTNLKIDLPIIRFEKGYEKFNVNGKFFNNQFKHINYPIFIYKDEKVSNFHLYLIASNNIVNKYLKGNKEKKLARLDIMNDFKLMEDEKFIKTIDNDNLKNRYLLLGFDYLGYKFYKCLSIEDNFGNLRNSSVGISYTFNDYFERSNKNLIDNLI